MKVIEKERNPPPETVPGKQPLKKVLPSFELDVTLEILADNNAGTISGAKTELNGLQRRRDRHPTSGIDPAPEEQKEPKPTDKITVPQGKGEDLRDRHDPGRLRDGRQSSGSKPEEEAAWGRGTTAADAAAKNITVGFHESCHRDDYIAYLTANLPIQSTSFRVGMTVAEFDAELDRIATAIDAWSLAAETASRAKTDETGTTMTDYLKDHPGATGH